MARQKVSMQQYLQLLNEALKHHPDYIEGMEFRNIIPELKRCYSLLEPTRPPYDPAPEAQRRSALRICEEVPTKINQWYEVFVEEEPR
jgi:hypothetical protein